MRISTTLGAFAISIAALCCSTTNLLANTEANQRLLRAVTDGSLAEVRRALDDGADPNWFGGSRWNTKPLCLATRLGKEEILLTMIDAGADAGLIYFPEADIYSSSAMSCAAHSRNLTALKILHEHGAQLDQNFCKGCSSGARQTALTAAIGKERWDITRYILNHIQPTEGEIRGIHAAVERYIIFDNDKTLDDREWVAEWLRERGHEVTPRAPLPSN